MRTETIQKTYLEFHELTDDQKEKVIERNFDDGFHYGHCMQERIESLKGLAKVLDGYLECSLSPVPDRGEYIEIEPKEHNDYELLFENLEGLENEDCPFTGVCYDDDLLESLKKHGHDETGLKRTFRDYIQSIHDEYESMLSFEYIADMCEANEYEFDSETLELV